jgi:UDPglucose 6-dehydrogenase
MRVGVIGYGTVGKAVVQTFVKKGVDCIFYDKFLECNGTLPQLCETCELLFLALPTPAKDDAYDLSALLDVLAFLSDHNYSGVLLIKSTMLPGTTLSFHTRFPNLCLLHNPEFLTARTAQYDFEHPKQIIIGVINTIHLDTIDFVCNFFNILFPDTPIQICTSSESECTKIMCNAFYAAKIQLFNEFYAYAASKPGMDFHLIKKNMLNQGWINPMHTQVPGHDHQFSFGGACLPKDTAALLGHMKYRNTPHQVLEAVLREREVMRFGNNTIIDVPQVSRETFANIQY